MIVPVNKISGFKEFLPEEQIVLERMKRVIVKHYELFGFAPIEVAAVERNDVLLSKSGDKNTKQIYSLHLLQRSDQEHGESEKDFSLHFDLTVPLARYVALNYGKLAFPFRRYQMQKVWRGEHPQESKGRFREFHQCDIDVIGDGALGFVHDAEMPLVIQGIFSELNIGTFIIRLNNRKITSGLLESLGLPETYVGGTIDDEKGNLDMTQKERFTFNLLDALEKVGTGLVEEAFVKFIGCPVDTIKELISLVSHKEASHQNMLAWLQAQASRGELFVTGVTELAEVIGHMTDFGMNPKNFVVDLGVTRGLDYYTSTVYETTLVGHENIGSICSGGRYDDLASRFIEKKLPGVGISIGLTRLFALLQRDKIIRPDEGPQCPSAVMLINMHSELRPEYVRIAAELRAAGIACEIYLEDRKVEKQTKYAFKKRIPYVVFLDQRRKEHGTCTVRHFNGEQHDVPLEALVAFLQK